MKPTLLILAAGIGSRYGSLKQMDQLGPSGETIIDYSVYDAIHAGFGKVVFVIRQSIEAEFRSHFDKRFADQIQVDYVLQELDNVPEGIVVPEDRVKPWGTGHAVLVAADAIQEPFAMINADDFYGREAFVTMATFLSQREPTENAYCMVGYKLENTLSDFGSVSRGVCLTDADGYLESVTERTKIVRTESGIVFQDGEESISLAADTIVSMNMFGFTPTVFAYCKEYFEEFIRQRSHELKSEFYVPIVISKALDQQRITLKVLSSDANWFGVTYKEDKPVVMANLADLTEQGVYPKGLWKVEEPSV
ncbi:MAG: sugar phosphate nucleotidyltransferase [Bacteroidota bacterium]